MQFKRNPIFLSAILAFLFAVAACSSNSDRGSESGPAKTEKKQSPLQNTSINIPNDTSNLDPTKAQYVPEKLAAAGTDICTIYERSPACFGPSFSAYVSLASQQQIAEMNQQLKQIILPTDGKIFAFEQIAAPYVGTKFEKVFCSLSENVFCWGFKSTYNDRLVFFMKSIPKKFVGKPVDIALVKYGFMDSAAPICLLYKTGIECFALFDLSQYTFLDYGANPLNLNFQFTNAQQIIFNYPEVFVLDDGRIKTLSLDPSNKRKALIPEDLDPVLEIRHNGPSVCAMTRNKIHCLKDSPNFNQEFNFQDSFKNPRNLAMGFNSACVIDDGGLKCATDLYNKYNESVRRIRTRNVKGIIALSNSNSYCVNDDSGIFCFNFMGEHPLPEIPTGFKN